MIGDIIKIPAVNEKTHHENMNVLISLCDISRTHRKTLQDPNRHLEQLINEYETLVKESYIEESKRVSTWKGLLGKYYKMTSERDDEDYYTRKVCYIYPYEIVDANRTLWVLCINDLDNHTGGIKDYPMFIEDDWNYNITLEEISKEEFIKHGTDSVEHVINRRLEKEKKKQNELDNQSVQEKEKDS